VESGERLHFDAITPSTSLSWFNLACVGTWHQQLVSVSWFYLAMLVPKCEMAFCTSLI
jgi:hypothetical protein